MPKGLNKLHFRPAAFSANCLQWVLKEIAQQSVTPSSAEIPGLTKMRLTRPRQECRWYAGLRIEVWTLVDLIQEGKTCHSSEGTPVAAEPSHCMRNNGKIEETKSKELKCFPKVGGSLKIQNGVGTL